MTTKIAVARDCYFCVDKDRQIDRLCEALERIISEGDYTAPEGMKRIAKQALQQVGGGE